MSFFVFPPKCPTPQIQKMAQKIWKNLEKCPKNLEKFGKNKKMGQKKKSKNGKTRRADWPINDLTTGGMNALTIRQPLI